jgi:putative ABC transport system permease protein
MSVLPYQDVRLTIRRLRKDAGTTIASVAALAFAIGAAAATWSLLSAVLLNPLPVAAPERLFLVGKPPPPNIVTWWVPGHAYPVYESIRDSGAFEAIAAVGTTSQQPLLVNDQGDAPQRRQVHFAAHDFFATLGIDAARGRTFTQDEDRRGAPVVAVLSDHYWRRVFNADVNVLGSTVTVAGAPATVIGILPRGFRGLQLSEAPDLYVPLHAAGDLPMALPLFFNRDPLGSGPAWIRIVGKLRPGETPAGAEARLNALDCLCERSPLTQREFGPLILTNVNTAAVPELVRGDTMQFTTLLSSTVGLLLLVGCLTVGMLLLLRTEDRRDELVVRLALGATRGRLAVSIAIEAAILCVLGALLAIPVALWLCYGIRAFQLPGTIDVERLGLTLAAGPWLAVTGTALTATGAIALLSSLMGVGSAGSPSQSRVLAAPRVTRRAPRTVLVAGQVAITLVLVAGAGLFTRSLIEALSLNPAIATDRIVTTGIDLTPYGYTRETAAPFVDELLERLRGNALIESASLVVPAGAANAPVRITIDGLPRELPSALIYQAVEDDYFSTIGLPIIAGRAITRSDIASSPWVAVVSESFAKFIADGGDPLGRRIPDWESIRQVMAGQGPRISLEVIGVVPDLIVNVNATAPLVVYQPQPPGITRGFGGSTLTVRAAGEPAAAMRETQATARALDSRVTLTNMMTLDTQLGQQMNPQRFGVYVLGTLGGIALLLTVLGTYVIAQSMVVRRRRELGIRAALGARSAQLRRLVLRDTARLVGIGLIAGLALTVAGAHLIRSLLYQVDALDPLLLAAVATGIFGLALLVSLRPALEAARVDLTRSLREE